MDMRQFDIIVVGGGVNSLVTAALMGKAGKSVLLLEAVSYTHLTLPTKA